MPHKTKSTPSIMSGYSHPTPIPALLEVNTTLLPLPQHQQQPHQYPITSTSAAIPANSMAPSAHSPKPQVAYPPFLLDLICKTPPCEQPLLYPLTSSKEEVEHHLPTPSNIHIWNNPLINGSLDDIPPLPDANIWTIPSLTFQIGMTYHHHLLLQDYLAAQTIPQGFRPILDRMIYNICPPFPFPKLNRICQIITQNHHQYNTHPSTITLKTPLPKAHYIHI